MPDSYGRSGLVRSLVFSRLLSESCVDNDNQHEPADEWKSRIRTCYRINRLAYSTCHRFVGCCHCADLARFGSKKNHRANLADSDLSSLHRQIEYVSLYVTFTYISTLNIYQWNQRAYNVRIKLQRDLRAMLHARARLDKSRADFAD